MKEKQYIQKIIREYLGQHAEEDDGDDARFFQRDIDSLQTIDDVRKLITEQFDGIMYDNSFEHEGSLSYIAFYPNQIKSIHNDGSWDVNDNNIYS